MDFIKNFTKAIESLADFQPHMFNGATEKELFALEEKLGLTLPSDFKVLYQTYNGQDVPIIFLIFLVYAHWKKLLIVGKH